MFDKSLFSKLCDIQPHSPDTWRGRIFLTFDIDWAEDFVLADCISLLERASLPATWFITHETPLLDRLGGNPNFEIALHPNFNPLFNGTSQYDAEEIFMRCVNLSPGAVGTRSHSVSQSSGLLDIFAKHGMRYESNTLIPWDAGISLKPWIYWGGELIRLPYHWEDDVACVQGWPLETRESYWYQAHGLNILDFHPIHVYLNTEDINRYERSRADHRDIVRLEQHRNTTAGVRTFLRNLIGLQCE
ncbi:polysaccharide deacetylase WbmS family protein [Achromobacter dolens]|uniref:polysaccharide deacetylase WbmS family protein n=1 Tax=Achromobacter dolens TaxID=1287738 RepID=UPI0006C22E47|nr:hypothetical protein [Achromobacter dolens]CUI28924.1 Uncharacterised protein [Achromobacter dolens]